MAAVNSSDQSRWKPDLRRQQAKRRAAADAWNLYDSLDEAYAVAGDLEKAIENYEKSVELNPENTNGIAALERLRAQSTRRR
jgi:tetratricopeptide (TPR) repeat protein